MNAKVRDVMTTPVVAVRPATSFKELAALLRKYRVSGFPVLGDDQKVIGVVSEADLLAKEALSADHAGTITAIMRHKDLEKADGVTAGDLMTRNEATHAVMISREPLLIALLTLPGGQLELVETNLALFGKLAALAAEDRVCA